MRMPTVSDHLQWNCNMVRVESFSTPGASQLHCDPAQLRHPLGHFGIGYLLDAKPSSPNRFRAHGRPTMKSPYFLVKRSSTAPRGEGYCHERRVPAQPFPLCRLDDSLAQRGRYPSHRRWGVNTQLWAVRDFFNDHLVLGIGAGPYFARDKYSGDEGQRTTVAGDLSFMAAYRFHPASRYALPLAGLSPTTAVTPTYFWEGWSTVLKGLLRGNKIMKHRKNNIQSDYCDALRWWIDRCK